MLLRASGSSAMVDSCLTTRDQSFPGPVCPRTASASLKGGEAGGPQEQRNANGGRAGQKETIPSSGLGCVVSSHTLRLTPEGGTGGDSPGQAPAGRHEEEHRATSLQTVPCILMAPGNGLASATVISTLNGPGNGSDLSHFPH